MLGRTETVLVSKRDEKGMASGRTRNFKEVFFLAEKTVKIGDLVPVKITELSEWVLRGERA